MLSPEERAEIDLAVYRDLAAIEHQASHDAGSFEYLCLLDGAPTFTHTPIGPVIRRITHLGSP